MWIHAPEETLSRARKGRLGVLLPADDWGTPLRSDDHPDGLVELPPDEIVRVFMANRSVAFCIAVAELCVEHQIPVVIAGTASSFFWSTSWAVKLRRSVKLQQTLVDQCAYGAPWRKTLLLWAWKVDLSHLAARCEPELSVCSFRHAKHINLKGRHPDGPLWASLAAVLPRRLRQAIASTFRAYCQNVLLDRKWNALTHKQIRRGHEVPWETREQMERTHGCVGKTFGA